MPRTRVCRFSGAAELRFQRANCTTACFWIPLLVLSAVVRWLHKNNQDTLTIKIETSLHSESIPFVTLTVELA
jgi:hypothetical protein